MYCVVAIIDINKDGWDVCGLCKIPLSAVDFVYYNVILVADIKIADYATVMKLLKNIYRCPGTPSLPEGFFICMVKEVMSPQSYFESRTKIIPIYKNLTAVTSDGTDIRCYIPHKKTEIKIENTVSIIQNENPKTQAISDLCKKTCQSCGLIWEPGVITPLTTICHRCTLNGR